MKNLSLLELVQKRTNENLKVKSTKNTCDFLHDYLVDQMKSKKCTRKDVYMNLLLNRLKYEFNLKDDSVLTDEQEQRLNELEVTVKNGLDTAVCNGKTPSSYNSNPKYSEYELIKRGETLQIVKK